MTAVKGNEMSVTMLRDGLADGSISAAEARKAIASLPKRLDGSEASALYAGFRAWTWKVLNEKRRDDELREWVDLISRARVRLGVDSKRDHQFETLAELVTESIAVAVRLPVTKVIAKRHVRDLLNLLGEQPEHRASKKVLMKELGLSGPNLTRVTNLLTPAGLVDIERVGRETWYSLSRRGAEEVGKRLLKPLAKEASWEAIIKVELSILVKALIEAIGDEYKIKLDLQAIVSAPSPLLPQWPEKKASLPRLAQPMLQLRNPPFAGLDKIAKDPVLLDPCTDQFSRMAQKLETAHVG